MSPEEIRDMLRRRPFEPFRIHVPGPAHYDVTQPEMVMVTPRSVHIGIIRNTTTDLYDAVDVVANIHVTRLEPIIPAPTTPA